MQNQKIAEYFKKYVPFSNEDLEVFFKHTTREVVEKNKYLTRAKDDDSCFYLIESGCLMSYITDEEDHKHILQFGTDLWWTGDIESIMNRTPSTWTIKAIERTTVYKLTTDCYEELVSNNLFERYFRILFQKSLISHQKRIIQNISFSAEKRYLAFINQFPQMELKAAQKYIASYLGVTPEFLSKLKKQMAERELK